MLKPFCLVLLLFCSALFCPAAEQSNQTASVPTPAPRYRVLSGPSGKTLVQRLNAEGAQGYRVVATANETLQGTARTFILELTPGSTFEYQLLSGNFEDIERELNRVAALGFRFVPGAFSLLSFRESSMKEKILMSAIDVPTPVNRLNLCVVERANDDHTGREYRFLRHSSGLEDLKDGRISPGFELVGMFDAGFAVLERSPDSKPQPYRFVAVKNGSSLASLTADGFQPVMGAARSQSWAVGQAYYLLALAGGAQTPAPGATVRIIDHAEDVAAELNRLAAQGFALDGRSSGVAGVYVRRALFVPAVRQKFIAVARALPPAQTVRYRVLLAHQPVEIGRFLDDPDREFRLVFFSNIDETYIVITEARGGVVVPTTTEATAEKQP